MKFSTMAGTPLENGQILTGTKNGGANNGNTCNTCRYNRHRKRGYYPNIIRAASLDRRKNESEKMAAYQF